jgi:mono/diheme cytochrome c family protein
MANSTAMLATSVDADSIAAWVADHRPNGTVAFRDNFDQSPATLAGRWSNAAPGDDAPAGTPGVNLDSAQAPAAQIVEQRLHVIEAGGNSDGWLVTSEKFDWTPERDGGWIQATFDLVSDRLQPKDKGAERIGYYISLHDYDGNSQVGGGNVLLDGNPGGGAEVWIPYPGPRAQARGKIGAGGFRPGHNYGVRVTNVGSGQFRLDQLVDWVAEAGTVTLASADLPDGGFGFEYCCGRSFVVDNVSIETGDATSDPAASGEFSKQLTARREELATAVKSKEAARPAKPGEIAWVTDLAAEPPVVPLLKRGRYFDPGEPVVAQAPLTPQTLPTVWSGVYTEAQAFRGEKVADTRCAGCHGPGLDGGDSGPKLVGEMFLANWSSQSVSELFAWMLEAMPADAPGTLTKEDASAVLAYILQLNKMPAGKEALSSDVEELKRIKIVSDKP